MSNQNDAENSENSPKVIVIVIKDNNKVNEVLNLLSPVINSYIEIK